VPADVRARATEGLSAASIGEDETEAEIGSTYRKTGRVVCPHTAVALAAARKLPKGEGPIVVLATAHPAKFPDTVSAAIGRPVEIPDALAQLADLAERFLEIEPDVAAARGAILSALAA
jgi:threonine synthase